MPDLDLLTIHGAPSQNKHLPLATVKFIGGLQTQRSPFASIDTRYNSRFLGGKPDALIDGSNVEISNSLTLQRRFGLSPLGPAIPAPLAFYEWEQTAPPNLQLIVDTSTAVYNYSTAAAGILLYKSPGAGQTNFWGVTNTLYFGNGVDLFKVVGPNLLTQSNSFSKAPWTQANASLIGGQFDPDGGLNATRVSWAAPGSGSSLSQLVVPNYTPVASNTFTFSIWLRRLGAAESITISIQDQNASTIVQSTIPLTQLWVRYQVTGVMGASSTAVNVVVGSPSVTDAIATYKAQLEAGGPATPAQITTTQPQGVYLWGIAAPTTAPALSQTVLSAYWQPSHTYNVGDTITDINGNLETVAVGGLSGSTVPSWTLLPNSTTVDGSVTWTQGGVNGLSPKTGYKWLFTFINEFTGQPSNVSLFSQSTSIFSNNLGVSYTLTGIGSTDPQVNQIGLYRNDDGGPFWFQVAVFANPAGGGTWTYVDTVQDINLSSTYAPIGLLNSLPPTGAVNPTWHQSRMWVSVGSNLFYSAGPDNASLLNVVQNGVTSESFALANVVPFDKVIIRSWPTTAGLLVWTVGDLWLVTGTDLASFNPVRILGGHGIRSFNAIDSDGSTTWMHTADKQFLSLNASAGSIELGFPIGDTLQAKVDPTKSYVARHVGGSIDNAVFIGDGVSGWFRVNPNQVGASVSGEPSPVWSPFATITGGAQAIASIQTSPGVHQLLVGAPGGGSIQTQGQLATLGANTGSGTSWTSPNNLTLNNPATPATVTLNVQGSPGSLDVFTGAAGVGLAVSTGAVTTGFINELGIVALAGTNSFLNAPLNTTLITAGSGWTLDNQVSGVAQRVIFNNGTSENDFFFTFGSESQALLAAGPFSGTAALSRSNSWSAAIATFRSGSGVSPTIVQQRSGSFYASNSTFTQLSVSPSSPITQGNFLVVTVGVNGDAHTLTVSDIRGNVFTPIQVTGTIAIFLAPISSSSGSDTITLTSSAATGALALTVYEITLPATPGTLTSKILQATGYNLNVPDTGILGVKVFVTGSQSSLSPDAELTLSWVSPSGPAPSYAFQLPLSSGTVSFGGVASTWGQTLTGTLLNNAMFGFQLQASVATTPNVTFNVSAVQVQVFYLNAPPVTFPILFRDTMVFADNGTPFTWSATIGSLYLASSGNLAETESITTEVRAASGAQPRVSVLLDEIDGPFESLPESVDDPINMTPSESILSKRFYLSQGTVPPLCRHMQVKLTGGATATKDELLALTIRGAHVPEQT